MKKNEKYILENKNHILHWDYCLSEEIERKWQWTQISLPVICSFHLTTWHVRKYSSILNTVWSFSDKIFFNTLLIQKKKKSHFVLFTLSTSFYIEEWCSQCKVVAVMHGILTHLKKIRFFPVQLPVGVIQAENWSILVTSHGYLVYSWAKEY